MIKAAVHSKVFKLTIRNHISEICIKWAINLCYILWDIV